MAFYLPQFHPIPENDQWWGKGFTEWTNVGKARPLFRKHYQPRVPADLGYYDLRLPEVREQQAQMAKEAGIEGFVYWHYWFGNGKTLLERPFQEVLTSGEPDFPFCLGWANHSWENKTWDSACQYQQRQVLIEQLYLGESDYKEHFFYVRKAFNDKRYVKIDDKPVFYIYAPKLVPDMENFISIWRRLAIESGLKGVYFIGQAHRDNECKELLNKGFDGVSRSGVFDVYDNLSGKYVNKLLWHLREKTRFIPLQKYDYRKIVEGLIKPQYDNIENIYPTILPNFDHSPRSGRRGVILVNSTPALFKKLLHKAIETTMSKESEHRIIFLRSWNEWAEGNYVEPDLRYGLGYLEAIKDEVINNEKEKE